MAEISYTWWHAGEKNLVTFGDCFSESLFEDLDCQFNSEVSDGLVNVPYKYSLSIVQQSKVLIFKSLHSSSFVKV